MTLTLLGAFRKASKPRSPGPGFAVLMPVRALLPLISEGSRTHSDPRANLEQLLKGIKIAFTDQRGQKQLGRAGIL